MPLLKKATLLGSALLFLASLTLLISGLCVDNESLPTSHIFSRDADHDFSFHQRNGYTCAPSQPCTNGACCGPNNICGYGNDYCTTGCQSNCDAKAECGVYAQTVNQTCPLKTCCSKYGFCGTTEDFCSSGCLSNCVLNPTPEYTSRSATLQRVIGYYESWAAERPCHLVAPSDLPLDGLTHLNYGFVYIDPQTFELIPMDPSQDERSFTDFTEVKNDRRGISVYASVGGWDFSDNGTGTQRVFGEIASSQDNRRRFAANAKKFLRSYQFDGLDVDWEYPGAPDRGGRPEDKQNFVELMRTIRQTFDNNAFGSSRLGLTFTAPSSYWYLRWFDVTGLLQYADWLNLMSYDLHGVWDGHNSIGNIIQSHTNLSDIKAATDLLWRNDVHPSKVSLGLGFYGRSFELEDEGCQHPGCRFRAGGARGPCSQNTGSLAYFEIKALQKNFPEIRPFYDLNASVKYMVYNDKYWVSYDDSQTFQQKIAWADKIGLGGLMIWSADMDDDQYSAMSVLAGRNLSHPQSTPPPFNPVYENIGASLAGHNGQGCQVITRDDCVNVEIVNCDPGWKKIGWDQAGCATGWGHLICCPDSSLSMEDCKWRGGWFWCNGQCQEGEVQLALSQWGNSGKYQENRKDCLIGHKAFCCQAPEWTAVTRGCYWGNCDGLCNDDEISLITKRDNCPRNHASSYCCPRDVPLEGCAWHGTGACEDNNFCPAGEVTIALAKLGDKGGACTITKRLKSACCRGLQVTPSRLICSVTTCDLDPDLCEANGDGHDLSDQDAFRRRSIAGRPNRVTWQTTGGDEVEQRPYDYPTPAQLVRNIGQSHRNLLPQQFNMTSQICANPQVSGLPLGSFSTVLPGMQVEHIFGNAQVRSFAEAANEGIIQQPNWGSTSQPNRAYLQATFGPIPDIFWRDYWPRSNAMRAGHAFVVSDGPWATSTDITRPVGRVYEAVGSKRNCYGMVLCEASINLTKGQLENLIRPMAEAKFEALVQLSLSGGGYWREDHFTDDEALQAFFAPLRATVAVFQYLRIDEVHERREKIVNLIRDQIVLIEGDIPSAKGLTAAWDEWHIKYFETVSEWARFFMDKCLDYVRVQYAASKSRFRQQVEIELKELDGLVQELFYKFEDDL